MPFMLGRSPIRRTTKYLEAGKIIFRENVKIFTLYFTHLAENHRGAREFAFWHLDQIQYKNPGVQCLTVKNLFPSPFIRIFLENTENVIINVDCREKTDIVDHLLNFTAICKTEKEISSKKETTLKDNKSLFGFGCDRHCMCEIMGQVPCPRLVVLPSIWRKRRKDLSKNLIIPYCYTEPGLDEIEDV